MKNPFAKPGATPQNPGQNIKMEENGQSGGLLVEGDPHEWLARKITGNNAMLYDVQSYLADVVDEYFWEGYAEDHSPQSFAGLTDFILVLSEEQHGYQKDFEEQLAPHNIMQRSDEALTTSRCMIANSLIRHYLTRPEPQILTEWTAYATVVIANLEDEK